METERHNFLWLARQRSVVVRAVRIATIVGVILAIINHGDAILSWTLTTGAAIKIMVTFFVPYCVSTYSSVLAIREKSQIIKSG